MMFKHFPKQRIVKLYTNTFEEGMIAIKWLVHNNFYRFKSEKEGTMIVYTILNVSESNATKIFKGLIE